MLYNNDYESSLVNGVASINVSNLPIAGYRKLIVDTIRNNQVAIIFGDTGSGKTTQIPQYIFEANLHEDGVIAVTQPRRIAAISMAGRVAIEMRWALGIEVGYEVRFESRFQGSTKIKYMTDGTLLNQCLSDDTLSDYSVIMIDEAHERSMHTDVLLGLLKRILPGRKDDLKVIITSATIKAEKFSNYFENAPILKIEGRLFPIEVDYIEQCCLYIEESVKIVKMIHSSHESGDILIFLTGQEEIDTCCENLRDIENLIVYPLYGSMDCDTQQNVFKTTDPGQRKVVVATNIAETTITIDGIKYVIDCGYVKQNIFNSRHGMEELQQIRISKAQADQRKGRAGRTCSGRCYRLYDKVTYEMFGEEAVPEIKRKNLCEIYLKLKAMDVNPMTFKFIDQPSPERLLLAESELQEFDLLDDSNCLTEMGRNMSDIPVEPILGKVLFASSAYGCGKDIVTIISMMTENNILKRINNKTRQNELQKPFYHPYGDHLTSLNVFNEFINNEKSKDWCYKHYLNYDKLIKVDLAREQLTAIMLRKDIPLGSLSTYSSKDPIRKAIIKGYYRNICSRVSRGKYIRYLDNKYFFIHPGSSLFEESPQLILYNDIIQTTKAFMHGIMKLDESVLKDFPDEMRKIQYRVIPQRRNFMDSF